MKRSEIISNVFYGLAIILYIIYFIKKSSIFMLLGSLCLVVASLIAIKNNKNKK